MKRKTALYLALGFIFLAFFICGCFAPKDFDVSINIYKNGKMKFIYNGLLVHLNARKSFFLKGEIGKDEDEEIKRLYHNLLEHEGYKQVTNLGGGLIKLSYEHEGNLTEPFYFISEDDNFFSLVPKSGNRVELLCYQAKRTTKTKLADARVKIRGKVTVTTDALVLSHNAETAPGQPQGPVVYRWDITSVEDPAPYMLLKLERLTGK